MSGHIPTATQSSTRTRVACKNCNARRVRCHRINLEQSCQNCRQLNVECELIDSKRGKYKRTSTRTQKKTGAANGQGSQSIDLADSPSLVASAQSPGSRERDPVYYASPSLPDLVIDQNGGDRHRVVYMGDSSNMKYLIYEVGDPFKNLGRRRLWGDFLQQGAAASLSSTTQERLETLRAADDEHLTKIGAFITPDLELREQLLQIFFDRIYPFFPIFDKSEFYKSRQESRISPLVLNAVYLASSIHCSEDLIEQLGFDSRYLACSTFYQRAKALYEKNYETDAISTIQACTLLMNWWQEPMAQKDTWFWLGMATHTAQGLGMHRAKSYKILSERQQRLWRRIWWILFVHDIHHAAVFGRPPHIHSQYSDVPALTADDMLSSKGSRLTEESAMFAPEYCRLAVLLDQCLQYKYSAAASRQMESQAWLALKNFPSTLPAQYQRPGGAVKPTNGFYPAVLELIHLDYLIVVERMLSSNDSGEASSGLNSYFKSAGSICRVLEDLLASESDLVAWLPFVAFPAIYCSIGIHIMYLRKETGSVRLVAEHRARFGMLVSHQLQDRWPFAVWTHYLLDRMLFNAGSSLPLSGLRGSQGEQSQISPTNKRSATDSAALSQPLASDDHRMSGQEAEPGQMPGSSLQTRVENLGAPAVEEIPSPLSFMFPWNGFFDDEMRIDQWLLSETAEDTIG
ncbi:fungal specific transcription factor domain-containing protein [Sarocladium implicatum]|nr:fungal specific transcription factor domain-containing protein [Sarocladium implicatum]